MICGRGNFLYREKRIFVPVSFDTKNDSLILRSLKAKGWGEPLCVESAVPGTVISRNLNGQTYYIGFCRSIREGWDIEAVKKCLKAIPGDERVAVINFGGLVKDECQEYFTELMSVLENSEREYILYRN